VTYYTLVPRRKFAISNKNAYLKGKERKIEKAVNRIQIN
jgi:hypothetical protein